MALSLVLVGFFLVCLRTLVKATLRCCSGVVKRKCLQDARRTEQNHVLRPPQAKTVTAGRAAVTYFVLKYMSVVSNVAGECAPSCLHSHSISSVT